jgi:pyruvate-formate lyase-activating enzyme
MKVPEIGQTEGALEAVSRWSPEKIQRASLLLLQRPPLIDIEAAASCNIACSFCPREAMVRPQRIMTPETFAAVERLLPDDAVVMFAGLGEPLMSRHLESYIARLKRRGISSCIITNGMLLTPARQRALIDAGIDQIQVSLHSLTEPGLAPIVSAGLDLSQLRRHIEYLAATRPEYLRVRINFVLTETNAGELPAVRALAERLGLGLCVRRQHTRGGYLRPLQYALPSGGCGIFASVTFITAQGDVMACVNDVAGDSRLGNAAELIWPEVMAWKREVIGEDLAFAACRGCTDDYRWAILWGGGVDEADQVSQGGGKTCG